VNNFTLLNTICRRYATFLSYPLDHLVEHFDRPEGPGTLHDGFSEECHLSGAFHITHDICFVLWKTTSLTVCMDERDWPIDSKAHQEPGERPSVP
jgi:hypothetical protein